MKVHSATSIQGKRDYMEDRGSFLSHEDVFVAMVCDGHGGDSMSKSTASNLPIKLIKTHHRNKKGSPEIKASKIRDDIIEWGNDNKLARSGTTVSGIVSDSDHLIIYNVGDSRTSVHLTKDGVVHFLKPIFDDSGKQITSTIVSEPTSFFTTEDHDGECNVEKDRINRCGGLLISDPAGTARLNGALSVTRAFGDAGVGKGLDHIPDVYWIEKKHVNGPILMYSDGLYEAIRKKNDPEIKHEIYHIAKKHGTDPLVKYAYDLGSGDNITAILVGD